MGAQQRVFRRRIRSVQATKKITKAMELIASSRIVKAQQQVQATEPYALELLRAVGLAASHTKGNHPLTAKARLAAARGHAADHRRPRAGRRVLGERDQGGRAAHRVAAAPRRNMEVVPFIVGRKGSGLLQVP